MNDSTHDSSSFQTPDEDPSPMMGYDYLRDLECQIARRIVAWATAPDMPYPYYRDYILLATPDTLYSKFMAELAFGLWRQLDPQTWLSWHDAPGSASSVWRHGILRAAAMMGGDR